MEHVLELVLAEHAMVYKYTGEILADGTVQEHSCHRRVYAPAQTEDNFIISELLAQSSDSRVDEGFCCPVELTSAYVYHEVSQYLHAALGMEHLGVELHAPCLLAFHSVGCDGYFVGRGDCFEACRDGSDRVAVAHPYLSAGVDIFHQRIGGVDLGEVCAAIFAGWSRLYGAS